MPVIVLVIVAIIDAALVFRFDLSVWHGGGFGMFSSVDHHTTRLIRVTAKTPRGLKKVNIQAYAAEVKTLKNLPTPARLQAFLNKLSCTSKLPAQTSMLTLTYYKLDFSHELIHAKARWQGNAVECS